MKECWTCSVPDDYKKCVNDGIKCP
jgi:hypothetical protein